MHTQDKNQFYSISEANRNCYKETVTGKVGAECKETSQRKYNDGLGM